jgi:ABC-type glycerol-3-phosphate transport system substrate-binding protein
MVQAFKLMYDWAKDMGAQKVQTYLATYLPAAAPPAQYPFYTGQLAMTISGDWQLSNIQEYAPKLNYGMTYIPRVSGHTPFTWSGGFAAVMPKGAGNPAGAYRFMRFMTGPEGQHIYTQVTAHMPTWAALLKDDSLFSGNHKFIRAMLSYAQSRVPLPVGAQLSDEFDSAQDKVVLNVATPEQALQDVYNRVQPQLQQYCPLQQ